MTHIAPAYLARSAWPAVLGVMLAGLPAARAFADGAPLAGLCAAGETTYFSCTAARGKSVALCGAPAATVQYRFGRPGAVEMRFPDAATGNNGMLYAHYSRYQTDRTEVRFDKQGVEYVVFDYDEQGKRQSGVRVTMGDSKELTVNCTGHLTSRLEELKGILQCDADSALNGGQCP